MSSYQKCDFPGNHVNQSDWLSIVYRPKISDIQHFIYHAITLTSAFLLWGSLVPNCGLSWRGFQFRPSSDVQKHVEIGTGGYSRHSLHRSSHVWIKTQCFAGRLAEAFPRASQNRHYFLYCFFFGCIVFPILLLESPSCLLTVSAALWSLNSSTTLELSKQQYLSLRSETEMVFKNMYRVL